LATLRGSWDAAAADLAGSRAFETASGGSEYGDDLLAAEAELGAWSGDLQASRGALDAARGRLAAGPPTLPLAWVSAFALRAEADEAEHARARRDPGLERVSVDRGRDVLDAWPGPPATPVHLLAEAEHRRLEGQSDPERWAAVVAAWDGAERPFLAAEARYRRAQALLASGGDRAAASALLAGARATCARLRAEALGQEVTRLARRARLKLGEPPSANDSGDGQTGPGGERLTPREADVLRLIAGGWTNRQIADELFISPRTAAVHVTNIFGKLGANSRVEAAAIAHRRGLVDNAPPPPDATALESGGG